MKKINICNIMLDLNKIYIAIKDLNKVNSELFNCCRCITTYKLEYNILLDVTFDLFDKEKYFVVYYKI
jgi:hypothetical protein